MRITDLHEDLAYASQKYDVVNGRLQSSIAMLEQFDSTLVLSSIFPYFTTLRATNGTDSYSHVNLPDRNVLTEQINFHLELEYKQKIKIVREPSDLDRKGVNLALAMEGADTLTVADDIFYLSASGLVSLGIAWNYDNKFAASYLSSRDYGLTGSGVRLVELCREVGVAIDLSHASQKTINDVLQLDHGPVFISHGNSGEVFDHPRNYPDRIVEKIAEQGGVIGVTGIPSTLGGNQDINDIVSHIEHFWEKFGEKSVAIGSDFLGVDNPAKGFESVENFRTLSSLLGNKSESVLWKNGYQFMKAVLSWREKMQDY